MQIIIGRKKLIATLKLLLEARKMNFAENLQNLRKKKNMTQDELAEKLQLSRQAVSKWESGSGYPETEKIISICEIFDCSMDELVRGKITLDKKDNYDLVMSTSAKQVSIAVTLILLSVSIFLTIIGLSPDVEQSSLIGICVILLGVAFAVPLFIVNGFKIEEFKKKNPILNNVYNENEVEVGKTKYTKFTAIGISIILMGVMIMMLLLGLKIGGEESSLPVAILMYFITIGTSIIVYASNMKEKFDILKYNKENTLEYKEVKNKVGKICGIIMLITTIIFLIWGFTLNMWEINWLVYPIGGILCGIISIIFEKDLK